MMRWKMKSTLAWAFSAAGTSTTGSLRSTSLTSAFFLGRPTATIIRPARGSFVVQKLTRRKSNSFVETVAAAAAAAASGSAAPYSSFPPPPPWPNNRMIQIRNATTHDLDLILSWDEKPHLQDPNVMGDEEYNDWNWEYELTRSNDLSWRYQLIAEIIVVTEDEEDDDVVTNTTTTTSIPIGFVQILDPIKDEDQYWSEMILPDNNNDANNNVSSWRAIDIWIGEEEYLGQGYGSRIMEFVLQDYCFGNTTTTTSPTGSTLTSPVEMVLVDPMAENTKAHRFYQKLGFKPDSYGYRYFGPDKCLVHTLTRDDYFLALLNKKNQQLLPEEKEG